MNLGNLVFFIGVMMGFLWGWQMGFYEGLVRLLGVAFASLFTLCFFRPCGVMAHDSVFKNDWGLAYGAAWFGLFAIGFVAFWVLGNVFLSRGKYALYVGLDRAFGVLFGMWFIQLLSSAIFIGIQLPPFTRKIADLLSPSRSLVAHVDSAGPRLFASLFSSGGLAGPLDAEAFMKVVRAMPAPKKGEATPSTVAPAEEVGEDRMGGIEKRTGLFP